MYRLFTAVAALIPLASARSGRFGVFRLVTSNRLNTLSTSTVDPTWIRGGEKEYEVRAHPAPGSPFHYAFPVHNLEVAKKFYGTVMGCEEGRSSEKWQDYSLHGHQIVAHWVGEEYRHLDHFNPVDGDEVPVPHFGIALSVDQFHELAERLKKHGVEFIIEPHLRFQGAPGEQWTMFFKDPSGNNLEFKAMTKPHNLFAKYNVVDASSA
ncbi:MAG: hypothetical protein SGBAC_005916 [Bacillariaceae sp.]